MKKKFKDISSYSIDLNKKSGKKFNISKNKKNVRKKPKKTRKGFFKFIYIFFKILVCLILLLIIGLSIVVTGLTVYVMKATEEQSPIKIDRETIMSSGVTVVMGLNENNKFVPLNEVATGPKRIWVNINEVPNHLKQAIVAIEDKNFYKHDGVDFKRTFFAFLNMFLHFWSNNQGGSTLTQQLLKNLTNDKFAHGVEGMKRKIREIYRAMNLEKTFTKDQILQAYLNIATVGGNYGCYEGIGSAAKLYFNKDVSELNLVESVAIVSLFRNPVFYDPIAKPENNKLRREKTLKNMLNLGMINFKEYENAVNSTLETTKGKVLSKEIKNHQSYFVDAALNQVVANYMELKKIDDWQTANDEVKQNGFKIYSTIDTNMQNSLEKLFANPSNFGCSSFKKKPKAACVVCDLNGNMKACVGGLGTKPSGDRVTTNYATSATIMPGSSFKPFTYCLALNKNLITYSTIFEDAPLKKINNVDWPRNFDKKYYGDVTVQYALAKSLNTIPVKIANQLKVEPICDFLIHDLHFSKIFPPSKPYNKTTFESEAIAIGSLTQGVKLSELTNAYQIFGNGGYFTELTTYEKITNSAGEIVFEPKRSSVKVIDPSTSAIMNRLLRTVVTQGTGQQANLDSVGIEVVGKTGTSDDEKSLTFVGVTPDYVIGVWIGGKGLMKPTELFNLIAKKIYKNNQTKKQFDQLQEFVVQKRYCKVSGLLANSRCSETEIGYYKPNFKLSKCSIH